MPKRDWIKTQKKDRYYREAKKAGYKSRAAFKLIQINKKFRILKPNAYVLDLCSAPGSWIQVVQSSVEDAKIIAVDIMKIKEIQGVTFIQEDITQEDFLNKLKKLSVTFDVILSDCAPKTTGIRTLDQFRQAELVGSVIKIAINVLKPRGHLVAKIFESSEINKIKQELKKYFSNVYFYKPEASKKHSIETYVIAKNFKKANSNGGPGGT